LATGLFTAYSLLSRKLAVLTINPRAFAVIYNATVAGIAVLFVVFNPSEIKSVPFNILVLTALAMLNWGVFGRMEFVTRKMVEASTLTIIFRISYVVTFVFSIILFKEMVSVQKIIALVLIVAANVLIFYRGKGLKFSKNLGVPLLTATVLGLGWLFDKKVSSYYPLYLYTFISFSFPSLFSYLTPPLPRTTLTTEIKITSWKIILLALVNFFAYYFFLKAINMGEISRVVLITSFSQILTIILGVWLFREREMLKEKAFAGVLVLGSIILLR
jgi:drug/metabolite transporter (DMT)-like permease